MESAEGQVSNDVWWMYVYWLVSARRIGDFFISCISTVQSIIVQLQYL
jgi:hypothetical protein